MVARKAARPATDRPVREPQRIAGTSTMPRAAMSKAQTLPIASIVVSSKRHRKDMGDIAGLAASMADLEMLEPIVVRPAGRGRYKLVCGARRLAGAKQLGQTKVPVIVRNLTDAEALKAEYAENTHRKDFTLSEAVAIKRALEPMERAAAKERQRAGRGSGKKRRRASCPHLDKGRAADKAAKATGMARRTLEKAEAIVDAAEAEPEKFGKLLERHGPHRRVNGVHRRLKKCAAGRAHPRRAAAAAGQAAHTASSSSTRRGRTSAEDPCAERA